MLVRFWGTRGSIAKPGPTTLRYGGNTSCVEVRASDGSLLVLDCGTGVHCLGQTLMKSGETPLRGNILITHYHWDHIQGFPFFTPLFIPGNEWMIHGPGGMGHHLEALLAGQMRYSYFPVTLEELGASVRFTDLGEGMIDIGPFRITTRYTNHPALTFGFRIEANGATLVYIPDHEPYSLFPQNAQPGTLPSHHEDRRHVDFIRGADLLIHDGQYTMEEYPAKISWGHCPFEKTVDYAIAAGAQRLAIFHHDPMREDSALDDIVGCAAQRVQEADKPLDVFAAAEGQAFELSETGDTRREPIGTAEMASMHPSLSDEPCNILIVDDDPLILKFLERSLAGEKNLRPVCAADGETALELATKSPPALILLDLGLPKMGGMEVCQELRAHADPRLRDVPIIIVTGKMLTEQDMQQCFEAGASDYITKNFTPTQLRSRVRGWLLRSLT